MNWKMSNGDVDGVVRVLARWGSCFVACSNVVVAVVPGLWICLSACARVHCLFCVLTLWCALYLAWCERGHAGAVRACTVGLVRSSVGMCCRASRVGWHVAVRRER